MRKCNSCGIQNNGFNFYKDKKTRDGLTSRCKDCIYKKINKYITIPDNKQCRDCGSVKPNNEFPKNRAMSDGLNAYCKYCANIRSIASRFRLTKEQYLNMLNGSCESCGSRVKLCIDHDHSCCPGQLTCGKCIRGVLCNSCNSVEGYIKTKEQLLGILAYMEKHNAFAVASETVVQ